MCKKCKCQKKHSCSPCVPPKPVNPPIVEIIRAKISAQVSGGSTPSAGTVFQSGRLGNGLASVAAVTAGQLNFF